MTILPEPEPERESIATNKLIGVKFRKIEKTLGLKPFTYYTYDKLEMDIRSCFEDTISADHLVDIFYVVNGERKRITGDRHLEPAMRGSDSRLIVLVEAVESFMSSKALRSSIARDPITQSERHRILLRETQAQLRMNLRLRRQLRNLLAYEQANRGR